MIPRALQDPPRPLQEASWYGFSMIWGSNLMVLIANLRHFRPPTWWILQLTNQPKKQSTNQPSQQTSPRKHTSRYPYIPRPGGGWAEGNWIRRPRRGAGRVQDGQPNPTNHQILLPDHDRPTSMVYQSKTPTAMDRRPLPLSFRPLWLHLSIVGLFAAFGVFAYLGYLHFLSRTFQLKMMVLEWS